VWLTWWAIACGGAKQPPPPADAALPFQVEPRPGPALPCLSGAECPSGVCEGVGCGEDTPGTCAPELRACTFDLRPYCGCDGKTFQSSGSCPGARYLHTGPCANDPLPPLPMIQQPDP
jgi:hypothetical protein